MTGPLAVEALCWRRCWFVTWRWGCIEFAQPWVSIGDRVLILSLGGLVATQAELRFLLLIHKTNNMMSCRLFVQGPGGWLCSCLWFCCQSITAFGLNPLRRDQHGLKTGSHLLQFGPGFSGFTLLNYWISNVFVQGIEQMVSMLPVFIRGAI